MISTEEEADMEKYLDSSLSPVSRAEDLLDRMTLEEKMAQVNCVLVPAGREEEMTKRCRWN